MPLPLPPNPCRGLTASALSPLASKSGAGNPEHSVTRAFNLANTGSKAGVATIQSPVDGYLIAQKPYSLGARSTMPPMGPSSSNPAIPRAGTLWSSISDWSEAYVVSCTGTSAFSGT